MEIVCDYGELICPRPATHEAIATREDGAVVERRPMCEGHAMFATRIYATTALVMTASPLKALEVES